jgi:WhiB family redox-sensing transcriptional regulator
MDQAACAGMGPDLFFPPGERTVEAQEDVERAKLVCLACPVRLQCLVEALVFNAEDGIWGGFTSIERRQLLVENGHMRRRSGNDLTRRGANGTARTTGEDQ